MSLDADSIVDRRRLARKVTIWRVLTVLIAVIAIIGFGAARFATERGAHLQPHIARVSISGIITGDSETLKLLRSVEDSSTARAAILSIESPGGTVSGSEELYEGIRKLAAKKPVVAVVGNTAASGAYIAAIGTDHIVSRGGAIIGSIGVIAQIPNATKLLANIGVQMETVRSSPLKAMPSGIEPTPPEALKALEDTVLDSFAWFKGLVQERRNLSGDELAKVANGRVFTGRQALPLKLVDEIGGESEAIAWLTREKQIDGALKVEDWKRPEASSPWKLMRSMSYAASAFGFEHLAQALSAGETSITASALTGLLALWSPLQTP